MCLAASTAVLASCQDNGLDVFEAPVSPYEGAVVPDPVNKDFKVNFTAYNAENIAKGLGLNLTSATVDKNGIYTTNTSDTTYSFIPKHDKYFIVSPISNCLSIFLASLSLISVSGFSIILVHCICTLLATYFADVEFRRGYY
mgnify:CR=1 FL=1